jgi:hypothetical protein
MMRGHEIKSIFRPKESSKNYRLLLGVMMLTERQNNSKLCLCISAIPSRCCQVKIFTANGFPPVRFKFFTSFI